MTKSAFKLLKPGDRVRVKGFNKFFNGKVFIVGRVGGTSYNPRSQKHENEIVTEYASHNCECGCKQSSRLALHAHNVDLAE